MTMRANIIAAIGPLGRLTTAEITQAIGGTPREVQDTLHAMDDDGEVFLRNGLYRLTVKAGGK